MLIIVIIIDDDNRNGDHDWDSKSDSYGDMDDDDDDTNDNDSNKEDGSNRYVSDLRSNEHYLSGSENNTWKTIKACAGVEPKMMTFGRG